MDMHRREELRDLEEDVGYLFERPSLLDQALTHKSYANEAGSDATDNERLEFLGDAVLDLVVSRLLYNASPPLSEGEMSKVRAFMVKEESLERIAQSFALGKYLRLGRGEELTGGRGKPSILADAFEALIAAIYLDGGFHMAFAFIEGIFGSAVAQPGSGAVDRDYKTRLQELCQARYGRVPGYHLIRETGPDHDKEFEVEILLGSRHLGRGRGRSKKEAEQRAAEDALEILE
jgi:ribonuclease-3